MEKNFSSIGTDVKTGAPGNSGARNIPRRDVGAQARDAVLEEKNMAGDLASDASEECGGLADRALKMGEEGRDQINRAARKFTEYAREHTGVVTLSALALGILVGRLLMPARD
ncbi:MAG: hypothetical protein ABIT01_01515 [Thermoanaerobaculia bacterium]